MDQNRRMDFAALQRRYLASACDQVDLLIALMRGMDAHTGACEEARRIVHNLRGTGGSYRFPQITTQAQQVEQSILAGASPHEVLPAVLALRSLLARLLQDVPA